MLRDRLKNYAFESMFFSNVCLLEGIPPLFPTGIPFFVSLHLLICTRTNLLVPYFPID